MSSYAQWLANYERPYMKQIEHIVHTVQQLSPLLALALGQGAKPHD